MPLRTVSNDAFLVMSSPLNTTLPRRGGLEPAIEFTSRVVAGAENREFGNDFHQKLGHLGGFAGRQTSRRLVQKKDLRVACQPQNNLELALFAVRQITYLAVLAVEEAGLFEQMIGLFID